MLNSIKVVLCVMLIILAFANAWAQGPINDSLMLGTPAPSNVTLPQAAQPIKTKIYDRDTSLMQKHSPKKATLLAVFLPGAGQVYNKKYWKVPLVYVAAGAALYAGIWNNGYYKDFKKEYAFRLANGYNEDSYYNQFQTPTLQTYRDYYRQNRDLSFILLGATYVLQIVDAAVDAHFYDFKITEDLSLNIQPNLYFVGQQAQPQLLFTFKF